MTQLSSPESVLKKLDAVYEQIDDLHEALDIFQRLNDQVHASCERIQAHEARLNSQLDKSRSLETLYEKAIQELEGITGSSEEKLAHLLSELNQERAAISETLESVNQGKQDTEALRQTLEAEITRIRENITTETEQFTTQLDALKDEVQTKMSQAIADGRKTIEDRLGNLSAFMDDTHEELTKAQDALEAFRKQISDNFDNKIEVLFKQQIILQQTVNEEISGRFSDESKKLKAFKDGVDERLNHKLEDLSVQQVRFQKSVSEGMFNKIAEETKKIKALQDAVEAESRRIGSEFEQERAKIGNALASVAKQEQNLEELQQMLTQHFTSQMETLRTEAQKKLAQAIEDSKYIVEEELRRLTSFKMRSEQEIRELKDEVGAFKDQISGEMGCKTEELCAQQSLLRESVSAEISEKFAEESEAFRKVQAVSEQKIEAAISDVDQEKALIRETLESLRSESSDISALHQKLDAAITRADDVIAEKTESFAAQVDALCEDSGEKLNQELEENKRLIQKETDGLSDLMKNATEELQHLKTEWQTFRDQIGETLKQKSEEIDSRHESLREAMTQEVASRVSEYFETAKASSEETMQQRMDEFFAGLCRKTKSQDMEETMQQRMDDFSVQQTERMEKMTGQLKGLEQTLSAMQTEQKTLHQQEQEKSARLAGYIRKLAQRQNESQPVLPDHEKRILQIEKTVSAIKKKLVKK